MSEEQIIRNCAPTLAGIKTASLFSCNYTNRQEIDASISRLNHRIKQKGLTAVVLVYVLNSALIYIYRNIQLAKDLEKAQAQAILSGLGYGCADLDEYICTLQERIAFSQEFPHEIGLFLGYPPEDVQGFIHNCAQGYKTVGYWKVYGDAEKAEQTFSRYRKCSAVLYEQWLQGSSLDRLVVAC